MDCLVEVYRVSGAFHPDISLAIADYYGKTGDDANGIRRVRNAAEKADGSRDGRLNLPLRTLHNLLY